MSERGDGRWRGRGGAGRWKLVHGSKHSCHVTLLRYLTPALFFLLLPGGFGSACFETALVFHEFLEAGLDVVDDPTGRDGINYRVSSFSVSPGR